MVVKGATICKCLRAQVTRPFFWHRVSAQLLDKDWSDLCDDSWTSLATFPFSESSKKYGKCAPLLLTVRQIHPLIANDFNDF